MDNPFIRTVDLGLVSFAAISHGWTDDMHPVWTEINGFQWPVPFPAGGSLEDLRKELLGLGLRYCWVDVLCLRQDYKADDYSLVGGETQTPQETNTTALPHSKEEMEYMGSLQKAEWRVDVPTIGNIYQRAEDLVLYMNGLGRTLDLNYRQHLKEDKRHWFNRAWTLQEMGGRGPGDKRYFLGGSAVRWQRAP